MHGLAPTSLTHRSRRSRIIPAPGRRAGCGKGVLRTGLRVASSNDIITPNSRYSITFRSLLHNRPRPSIARESGRDSRVLRKKSERFGEITGFSARRAARNPGPETGQQPHRRARRPLPIASSGQAWRSGQRNRAARGLCSTGRKPRPVTRPGRRRPLMLMDMVVRSKSHRGEAAETLHGWRARRGTATARSQDRGDGSRTGGERRAAHYAYPACV